MNDDLQTALANLLFTVNLILEDLHVRLTAEEKGYEEGQHLRKAYEASRPDIPVMAASGRATVKPRPRRRRRRA